MMHTDILQSTAAPQSLFRLLWTYLAITFLNNTLETLNTKDVNMTKLFQQKLFARLANNSGTAEAAFLVNRTFSIFKGTCLY